MMMDEPPLAVATLLSPHKKDLAALGRETVYHRPWMGKPRSSTVTRGRRTTHMVDLLYAASDDGQRSPPYAECTTGQRTDQP